MLGVNLFASHGPGGVGQPVSLPDIPQIAERRVDHLEKRLEAGKLDTDVLDKRLQAHFGETAKGIVGEDGSVDFDRLEKLIIETRSEKLQDRITHRFGEKADGIVGSDGSIDKERLRELFAENRIERIFDRLEKRYGDAVNGVIGEDGSIDFDALKELIASAREVAPLGPPVIVEPPVTDLTGTPVVDEVAATDEIETTVPPVSQADETSEETGASETDESADARIRATDQLSELRKILFHERLESRFGVAADRIFKEDGDIDFEALRELFEGRDSDRPEHLANRRGHYFRPPIFQRPFFDLRA